MHASHRPEILYLIYNLAPRWLDVPVPPTAVPRDCGILTAKDLRGSLPRRRRPRIDAKANPVARVFLAGVLLTNYVDRTTSARHKGAVEFGPAIRVPGLGGRPSHVCGRHRRREPLPQHAVFPADNSVLRGRPSDRSLGFNRRRGRLDLLILDCVRPLVAPRHTCIGRPFRRADPSRLALPHRGLCPIRRSGCHVVRRPLPWVSDYLAVPLPIAKPRARVGDDCQAFGDSLGGPLPFGARPSRARHAWRSEPASRPA